MPLTVIHGDPDPAADGQASELEAQAGWLELQAAGLRREADRLSDQARRLRAAAQRRAKPGASSTPQDEVETIRVPSPSRLGALPKLTRRQQEIIALIARGYTNRRIAEQLVIATGTVANHIAQMLDRLGVDNRVQLAAWAIEHEVSVRSLSDHSRQLGQTWPPPQRVRSGEVALTDRVAAPEESGVGRRQA